MRPNAMSRALVTTTAVLGLTAGGISGVSFAATAPLAPRSTASEITPLAVVNLGLTTAEAKKVQCFLDYLWDYDGDIDGALGTQSWKAMQRYLVGWGYEGAIDGIVGPGTVMALQQSLRRPWGYGGKIDGIAGAETKAAFKRFAENTGVRC
ncbi:peptidoglycan-binding protein [Streptomyces sp. GMY02]|uniref:peptidoglycan-binding domain-containing protein n=1 Tax=Streptomyces sp. GMY02 TaxID=1333528 RepID=UPI001C2B926D|nr:peptidoglycan-binding domain-containing protein [Streptomyces sp. GMY02]QXE35785.1 peptidoglycan-binding protein [Streptomyces sp. GMY02]